MQRNLANVLAFEEAKPCQRARIRCSETLPTCSHSIHRTPPPILFISPCCCLPRRMMAGILPCATRERDTTHDTKIHSLCPRPLLPSKHISATPTQQMPDAATVLAVNGDQTRLYIGEASGAIQMWRLKNKEPLHATKIRRFQVSHTPRARAHANTRIHTCTHFLSLARTHARTHARTSRTCV